jgi:preprotein translocase SecE subunit
VAEETNSKPKRQIRKVETVREQTVKTAEQAGKVSRGRVIWHGFTSPIRLVGRGFRKLGAILGKYKVMRFIGRILVPTYFRNSWKELRQVTWLKWKQSRQLTTAVIIFSIIFGAVVAVLDFGLDKLFKEVLVK